MTNIIEIQNVTKTFPGGVVAVDDVSLGVKEGEFITMLGPSGCGKTTTLRMIGGFEYPDRGRILLGGEDVTERPPYKRQVNMMFQDFALFPHMTVAQNVGYGLRIAGVPKEQVGKEVTAALRMIELPEKAQSLPSELSSGQKQRVALARALVRRPKVLLLDEPLSALDAKLREQMQVELRHLHEKLGLTFILVTHDQTEAMVMSDRIVVMNRGQIVQIGSPTELYDRPGTPYVANFLGTSNMIIAKVTDVGVDGVVVEYGGNAIRVTANVVRPALGASVMLSIRPEKIQMLRNGVTAPEGYNLLNGVIRERFFHGDAVRVALDVGGEKPLVIHQPLDRAGALANLPGAGSSVTVAMDPASIAMFEELSDYEVEDQP